MLFHQIFVTLTEGKRRFLRFTTYKSISNAIDYRAQHQMPREIVKELDSKLFITLDGYDELVKQQGLASTLRKFKAAQEPMK